MWKRSSSSLAGRNVYLLKRRESASDTMAAKKCWDGYEKRGTKKGKGGKTVNNCVKKGTPRKKK